jgi:hypothetical protein
MKIHTVEPTQNSKKKDDLPRKSEADSSDKSAVLQVYQTEGGYFCNFKWKRKRLLKRGEKAGERRERERG